MPREDERLAALAAQVRQLFDRVAALEAAQGSQSAANDGSADSVPEAEGVSGAITYAGTAAFGDHRYRWQMERPVSGLLGIDPASLAPTLAALGHPLRLQLLRTLLHGPQSRQRLQDELGPVSTGQFYHHLKELLAVGLVTQRERNVYMLAARHVIPLLTIVAASYDLLNTQDQETIQPRPHPGSDE